MAEVSSPLRPYPRRFAIEPTKIQIFIGPESAGMVARTISLQRSARRPLHASRRLSRHQGDRGPHGLGFCLHEGCFKTHVPHRSHTARASSRNVCRRNLTMDHHDVIAALNDLLEISRDGEQGFRTCAEGVESPNLKALFEVAARRCAAAELEAQVRMSPQRGAP
jgi:Domain of unknown function (DUF2383)